MKSLEGTTSSPGQISERVPGLGVISVPVPVIGGPSGVGPVQGPTIGELQGGVQGEGEAPEDGDYVVDIYMQHEPEEDTANESTAKSENTRPHVPVVQVDG